MTAVSAKWAMAHDSVKWLLPESLVFRLLVKGKVWTQYGLAVVSDHLGLAFEAVAYEGKFDCICNVCLFI